MKCAIVVVLLMQVAIVAGQRWQRCPTSAPRCGWFNIGFKMYEGTPGTSQCYEFCTYFWFFQQDFTCGECGDIQPTPAPSSDPTSAPTLGDCSGTPCVFGLGSAMHRGLQDTEGCEEICTFNPSVRDSFRCGYCNSDGSEAPTPAPTGSPTPAPSISRSPSMTPTVTAVPVNPNAYEITLELVVPTEDKSIFEAAAAKWESVISGDLPELSRSELEDEAPPGCSYPRLIDDIYICGKFAPIDGPGNTAGFARPLFLRGTSDNIGLPVASEVVIDVDDLRSARQANLLDDLVTHEMGHALGFGLIWDLFGTAESPTKADCEYTGAKAIAAYKNLTGCDSLPLDQDGGVGTQCLHWEESCLGRELMTGTLDFGHNPLSRISVASLEDLGYEVNYDNADPITPQCSCSDQRKLLSGLHGSVRSLANQKKVGLSPALRKEAIRVGTDILEQSSRSRIGRTSRKDAKATYVGDKIISVLMRQDDEYFGVLVVRSSF